jgi:enediyne biosynthesis protein E4
MALILPVVAVGQTFEEVSLSSGIDFLPHPSSFMGGGVAVFDFNNDGLEDIYFAGCLDEDALFKNLGNDTFENVTESAGLLLTGDKNTTGVVTGDIDNDGDRDVFVTTWRAVIAPGYASNYLFRNNGDETFTDITLEAGLADSVFSLSASFIDLNQDGFLDLYVGNYVENPSFIEEDGVIMGFNHDCFEDFFYLNNGDLTFSHMAEDLGINNAGCALAMSATDYDRDGDSDLMVANDFGEFIIPNRLYNNNYPDFSMDDVAPATGANIGLYGMGVAIGDYDEDQDLDYYITNLGANVLLNQTEGLFEDVALESGVINDASDGLLHTSWGTFFADLDNDTYLDLFVTNGHIPTVEFIDNHVEDPNLYYHNNSDGTFTNIAPANGLADVQMGRGCAYGDFNLDGQLDIVVVNVQNPGVPENLRVKLFENQGTENHWLDITLEGVLCNRDAFGSQVELFVGDRIFLRELNGGGGCHASQESSRLHFGLGTIEEVDSLVVHWPGGVPETFLLEEIDTQHHLVQGISIGLARSNTDNPFTVYPMPNNGSFTIHSKLSATPETIYIYDVQGCMVYEQAWRQGKNSTDIQLPRTLARGMYTLQLAGEMGVQKSTLLIVE